jgi:hypothetical protein
MNKKGMLFHIIVFGIVLAVGLFFYISATSVLEDNQHKAEWQLEFSAFYQDAKITLLSRESLFRFVAWQSIQGLAENGGYNNTVNGCGKFDDRSLWNKKEDYCFSNVKEHFTNLFEKNIGLKEQEFFREGSRAIVQDFYSTINKNPTELQYHQKLITVFPKIDYEYIYQNETFYGITTSKVKFSDVEEKMKYLIEPSFSINLGYNIEEEYYMLAQDATRLLHACRNVITLKDCLEEKKEADWHFTNCDSDTYISDNRKVKFCAQSPSNAKIFNFEGELEKIEYLFALDFTATGPSIINEIFPVYNAITESYEISFIPSNTAESYTLYVGPNIEFSGTVFDLTYFSPLVQNFDFIGIEPTCPQQKESGFAYECIDLVTYVLHSSSLEGTSPYSFSVTSTLNNVESDIYAFVIE